MKSPLFWKLFLSFWLTAMLINQSTWIMYTIWWEPGPSWERAQSERAAPVELAAAGSAVALAGLDGFERQQAALPPDMRGNVRIEPAGPARDDPDVRSLDAATPEGVPVRLVYRLADEPERPYSLVRALYRSADYMLASMLGGMMFAAVLAWYLTRPIRRVRAGLGALARGDLGARLAPAMKGRRDEFADLARDFDFMAERLQQLVAMRDQLLHDVSHELRSPLARMTLAIGLHRQGKADAEPSLRRIESETRRLDELVGELLSLARAESGAVAEDRYFDLIGLVEAAATSARFEGQPAKVEVRLVCAMAEGVVRGSPELMRRALENVLRNAVAVSPPGQAVTVTVGPVTAGAGPRVKIEVEDAGPGVPPATLETIFDPFVRVDGAKPGGGYGLGLAIARRAVGALNGDIRARNRAQGGLSVVIDLPLASMPADAD